MLLKIGSKGEDVKKLQLKLNLVADGVFGEKTDIAVKNFQKANNLTVDGIVGDTTWNKLFIVSVSNNMNDKIMKLKGYIPDSVLNELLVILPKSKLTNVLRLAHFLAQCSEESINFSAKSENLNYSLKTLINMKKYFPTQAIAESYANKPEKIGSKIYANRMGNGNELTKEGYIYRGRGFIQLTGKTNYSLFSKYIGEDCVSNPDLVSSKYPLESALYYFDKNNLWSICDKGSDYNTVKLVTLRVNGGYNGLEVRYKFFEKYFNLLK